MPSDYIIFDLDGTISDPKDGIARSINFALECHNFEAKGEDEIGKLIGLPLDQMYAQLIEATEPSLVSSLIARYRERYVEIGYAENTLYEGMEASLRHLHASSAAPLAICTTKKADVAKKILEMFGLDDLFEFVSGGDIGIKKYQQLEQLLYDGTITRNSLMVGDRFVDIRAARRNQLRSAAVLWGYGSRIELENEQPTFILEQPLQIKELAV
ncbi:MAG TPA: HAD family hydrolase [Gammaproteobacteria bacterium]|jgi:phosphoglycolate phosphatase|nr:HAD family hydrolase [Gammaproteobacteria bacterium]|tara:strand:+ start:1745 stop:2383 length:639 start_codon:yes stop_codon:yes gene_type:complete